MSVLPILRYHSPTLASVNRWIRLFTTTSTMNSIAPLRPEAAATGPRTPSPSGVPDQHDEGSSAPSRPPSPPPSSPSQESHDVQGCHGNDPIRYCTRLEHEISVLRTRVDTLSHQLLYSTGPPVPLAVPYCVIPHVLPGTSFFSTVRVCLSTREDF